MQEAAIMVTGGAGCLGQQVVRRLAERGRTVVAVYHHKLPESFERVYPVCADFSSPELMAAPLRGVETVVHLAWEGGLSGPGQALNFVGHACLPETANLRMLRHLITAMERAGTRRLVLLSAAGAARGAVAPFLQEKYAAESLLLNSRIAEKVILRSAVMWGGQGSSDRLLRSMLRVLKFPVYPLPRRDLAIAPVHVQDLAEVVVQACSQPLPMAAALQDVHGGEAYAVADLFKMVSDRYVRRPRLPLGGFLGESLLPLLERDKRGAAPTTKLQHLLVIGATSKAEPALAANTSHGLAPQRRLATFQERILEV